MVPFHFAISLLCSFVLVLRGGLSVIKDVKDNNLTTSQNTVKKLLEAIERHHQTMKQ